MAGRTREGERGVLRVVHARARAVGAEDLAPLVVAVGGETRELEEADEAERK